MLAYTANGPNIARKISRFLDGAHEHHQAQIRQQGREKNFCRACESDVAAVYLHVRKMRTVEILNASDYQRQIFSCAFYSSIVV